MCEAVYGLRQGNGPTNGSDTKDKSAKKAKRPGMTKKRDDGFSGGEKDLYGEYN